MNTSCISQGVQLPCRMNSHNLLREERSMQCPRCQGTMVVDHFVDMATSGEIWMPGWRCLMCGEVIDPLILKNRQSPPVVPGRACEQSHPHPPAPLAVGGLKSSPSPSKR